MDDKTPLAETTFPVGRYLCRLTVPRPRAGEALSCSAEWTPEVPKRLTDSDLREYRAGRDAVVTRVAHVLGRTIAVLEF